MKGFEISEAGRKMVPHFLGGELLRELVPNLTENELRHFLRQWVSEGIPFAFRECPMAYEGLRTYIGERLRVEPRNITIIGSARVGCSLSPNPKFGKPYGEDSDLDLAIISDRLFANVVADFELWKSKISRKEDTFANKFGQENLDRLPANIERGFIDAHKIDHRRYLERAALVTNTADYAKQRLQSTEGAPKLEKLSVRIYEDFDAFFRQMRLNLDHALASL